MTEADLQPFIAWLAQNPGWVVFALFITAFVESLALAGVVVPGVLFLFVIAAAAGTSEIPLEQALFAGFLGAVLGDVLSFYIGHILKERLHNYWPFSRYPSLLALGADFFNKHGGKSVVIGRFVGPIRPVLPLVAGSLNMSPVRFITFNIFSALAWAPLYILPGYFAGAAVSVDLPNNFYSTLIIFLTLIALLGFIYRYASIHLQQGGVWYDTLHLQQKSTWITSRSVRFLTRHNTNIELPYASAALGLCSTLCFLLWTFAQFPLSSTFISAADDTLFSFATTLRSPNLDYVLVAITLVGDELLLIISFILLVAYLFLSSRPAQALHYAIAGIAVSAVTHALKLYFEVDRPDWVSGPLSTLSYPSGHTSGATVFFGLCAASFAARMPPNMRWKAYLGFSIPILMVGLSRILLGVHWFSDVVGGVLLGAAICGITRVIYRRYAHETSLDKGNINPIGTFELGFGLLWLTSLVFYELTVFDQAWLIYQPASLISVDNIQLMSP